MIYGWGEGNYGALGSGDNNDSFIPKPLKIKVFDNKEETKENEN